MNMKSLALGILGLGATALAAAVPATADETDAAAAQRIPDSHGCGVDASYVAIRRCSTARPRWDEVAAIADPDADGISSLVEVAEALKSFGIRAAAMRSDGRRIPPGPSVLHLTEDPSQRLSEHLLYVEPREDGTCAWFAPPWGGGESRWEEVAGRWSGAFVAIGPGPRSEPGGSGPRALLFAVVGACAGAGCCLVFAGLARKAPVPLTALLGPPTSSHGRQERPVRDIPTRIQAALAALAVALSAGWVALAPEDPRELAITPGPRIALGKLPAGSHSFSLTCRNLGESNLELLDVESSCGCTVPQVHETSLGPGRSVVIPVDLTVVPGVAKVVTVALGFRKASGDVIRKAVMVSFLGVSRGVLDPTRHEVRLSRTARGTVGGRVSIVYRCANRSEAPVESPPAAWRAEPASMLAIRDPSVTTLADGALEYACWVDLREHARSEFLGGAVYLDLGGKPPFAIARVFALPEPIGTPLTEPHALFLEKGGREHVRIATKGWNIMKASGPEWVVVTSAGEGMDVELPVGVGPGLYSGWIEVLARDASGTEATLRVSVAGAIL